MENCGKWWCVCVCAYGTDVEDRLGSADSGAVYGLFDYTAHSADELSFHAGDKMFVIHKGDDVEKDWWWARLHQSEGYIPKNYIGVSILTFYLYMALPPWRHYGLMTIICLSVCSVPDPKSRMNAVAS